MNPERQLLASLYVPGPHGEEIQRFSQPVGVIPGTGRDAGSVVIDIGDAVVSFNVTEALIAALSRESR